MANDPRLMAKSEDYVPKLRESAAGTKVAVGVKRAELMSLHQDHNEPFRTFAIIVEKRQKLVISLQLKSVNVERKRFQVIQKKQLKT